MTICWKRKNLLFEGKKCSNLFIDIRCKTSNDFRLFSVSLFGVCFFLLFYSSPQSMMNVDFFCWCLWTLETGFWFMTKAQALIDVVDVVCRKLLIKIAPLIKTTISTIVGLTNVTRIHHYWKHIRQIEQFFSNAMFFFFSDKQRKPSWYHLLFF